jgi:hypothetical protein
LRPTASDTGASGDCKLWTDAVADKAARVTAACLTGSKADADIVTTSDKTIACPEGATVDANNVGKVVDSIISKTMRVSESSSVTVMSNVVSKRLKFGIPGCGIKDVKKYRKASSPSSIMSSTILIALVVSVELDAPAGIVIVTEVGDISLANVPDPDTLSCKVRVAMIRLGIPPTSSVVNIRSTEIDPTFSATI